MLALVPESAWLSRLGDGKANGIHQHLCSLRNLLPILAPPANILRLVNESPSHTPQPLFKLLLLNCVSSAKLFSVLTF